MSSLPALASETRPSFGGRLTGLSGVSVQIAAGGGNEPPLHGMAFISKRSGPRRKQIPPVQAKACSLQVTPNRSVKWTVAGKPSPATYL